jgi:hypothetical protein
MGFVKWLDTDHPGSNMVRAVEGQGSRRLAPERLAGSWAKLTRAQGHVEDLKWAIIAACDGEGPPRVLATRREFDPENNFVLWIAERVPEVSDDWGLMVGDAIHNMRCALDHLWWQLAIDHLGRKPTEDEAREIMFPILTFLDPERFRRHRYLKHVSSEAVEKAERCQRYDAGENEVLLLTILATLSNRDKHREIQPAFFVNTSARIPITDMSAFVDCELTNEVRDGMRHFEGKIIHPPERPAVGDVVAGMSVTPTGPSPDIEVDAEVTGEIFLGTQDDMTLMFGILDEIGQFVGTVINWFAPLLRPPEP